jgi:hypothetical protein
VDEDAWREQFDTLRERPCVFQRALFTRLVDCAQARWIHLAERVGVSCGSAAAQAGCRHWLELLRDKSRFALHRKGDEPLRHFDLLRMEIGGILGLQRVVLGREPARGETPDVHALIRQAEAIFGALEEVPFEPVVQSISAYRVRRRRKR